MSSYLILPFANEVFRRNKTIIQAILQLGDVKIHICKNLFDIIIDRIRFLMADVKEDVSPSIGYVSDDLTAEYYFAFIRYASTFNSFLKPVSEVVEIGFKYDGTFIITTFADGVAKYDYDHDKLIQLLQQRQIFKN